MTTNICHRIAFVSAAKSLVLAIALGTLLSPMLSLTAQAQGFTFTSPLAANTVPVALDPTVAVDSNGNIIDRGSLIRVDHYVRDDFGRLYREVGYQWTSQGVPQNNLSLVRIQTVTIPSNPVVVFSPIPHYPSYIHSHVYFAGHFPHYHHH